jgi:hypothetical protein
LKKSLTIRLGENIIGYFNNMSEETGVTHQNLINLYSTDGVEHHRKVDISWQSEITIG